MEKIDFVVPWVDSNDKEWINLYNLYRQGGNACDKGRFRNWNIFQYWFRAVETYAPWVNKVYLITNGTVPKWINRDCPKLVLVNHQDYIPDSFLPTFNSCAIELNLHRIENLSEHFVYFNDDVFLNAPTTPEYFFQKGLPCDCNIERAFCWPVYDPSDKFGILISLYCNMAIINRYFYRPDTVRQSLWKWIGPHRWSVGKWNYENLLMLRHHNFEFFRSRHWEQPMLKSVLREIWEKEPKMMTESCSRFRQDVSLNQYIVRYWQFATNRFHPVCWPKGHVFTLNSSSAEMACAALREGELVSVCLNDSPFCKDDEKPRIEAMLIQAFEQKFPNRSMFEKEGALDSGGV